MGRSISIEKTKILIYVRRSIQVLCFVFLPALFIQIFNSLKAVCMLAFHGQGTLTTIMPDLFLLFAVSIVTIFAGRFFCGWMCAFGSLGDFLYKVPRRFIKSKKKMPSRIDDKLKIIKYIILGFVVILLWILQIGTIPSGLNPWEVFGVLALPSGWQYIGESLATMVPGLIILILIMLASVCVERCFCRYLCPLGAYFSLISRFRPIKITRKNEDCGRCQCCNQKCSMGISVNSMKTVKTGECINCMECVKICPTDNIHMYISEQNRKILATGTLSCAMIAGGYYIGNFYQDHFISSAQTADVTSDVLDGIAASVADGVYTGSAPGYRGETTVEVTVKDGKIQNIDVLSTGDDGPYMDRAKAAVIGNILGKQSVDVDAVSGATYSSNAIMQAVKNALSNTSDGKEEGAEDNNEIQNNSISDVADGTYIGNGTGFRGDTIVSVSVKSGKITDIKIVSTGDDKEYFDMASPTVISSILSSQTVGVDAVSGATYSSNGIIEAVADALGLSYTPNVIEGEGEEGQKGHKGKNY